MLILGALGGLWGAKGSQKGTESPNALRMSGKAGVPGRSPPIERAIPLAPAGPWTLVPATSLLRDMTICISYWFFQYKI